jgi:hypothetical protein
LSSYFPEDRRVLRAAERVILQATRLRDLCAAVPETPETVDGQENWREMAGHVIANLSSSACLPVCCTSLRSLAPPSVS